MRLLQVWRESREKRLENEFIDLAARIKGMSSLAASVCFNDIQANQHLATAYDALPVADLLDRCNVPQFTAFYFL